MEIIVNYRHEWKYFVVKPGGHNHFQVSGHYPWNAIPDLDVSARPPPANPVPISPVQQTSALQN